MQSLTKPVYRVGEKPMPRDRTILAWHQDRHEWMRVRYEDKRELFMDPDHNNLPLRQQSSFLYWMEDTLPVFASDIQAEAETPAEIAPAVRKSWTEQLCEVLAGCKQHE